MSIAQKGRATIYYLAHAILILVGCLLLVVEWSDQGRLRAIIDAVGTSMIATGGAGIVLFLYVAREATRLDLINEVESAGVVRILPFRSTKIKDEYDKRIRRAKSIDILGIGLSAFREDYRDELGEIARRAKVRILLLDPTAPSEALSYASQKDREEKNPDGKSAADVREFVNTFGPLKRRGKYATSSTTVANVCASHMRYWSQVCRQEHLWRLHVSKDSSEMVRS